MSTKNLVKLTSYTSCGLIMATQKGSKVIAKKVIGPFEGLKMVFNLCQFLQVGANI